MATQRNNVEIVRETYEAFWERDLEVVLERFAEDIEWIEPEGWPYGGTYRGPDAVVENIHQAIPSDHEDFEIAPDRFIDGGDTVVVLGNLRGTVAATGKSFEIPYAQIVEVEDGQITRVQDYFDTTRYQQAAEA